jgi:hypothetical protein
MHHNIFVTVQRWITALSMCFMLPVDAAMAGPIDDMVVAPSKGDYLQDFRTGGPLAAEGNAEAQAIFHGSAGKSATPDSRRGFRWNGLISVRGEEDARAALSRPLIIAEAQNANTKTQSWYSAAPNPFDQFDTEPAAPKQEPVPSSLGETAIRVVPMKSPIPREGLITDGGYIEISGDIRKSAIPRLFTALDQARKLTRYGVMVSLNSRGGEVKAAMEIGIILRSQEAHVLVQPNAECNSACILVLAGGVHRDAFEGSKLGIHRPSFHAQEFAQLSHAEAQGQYRELSALVKRYLSLMGIADGLYDAMMRVPSRQIKYISREVAEANSLIGSDPAHEEWVRTKRLEAWGKERVQKLDQRLDCLNAGRPEDECSHYTSGW